MSNARKLAFAMGSHTRLGANSPVLHLTDDNLLHLILSYCSISIMRAPAPPLPAHDKLDRSEIPIDISTPLFGGGRLTAQQFLNQSGVPFQGRCGGVGARGCVAFKVTRIRQINNASLWRPYHWRKQTIVSRLPEILGRVVGGGGERLEERGWGGEGEREEGTGGEGRGKQVAGHRGSEEIRQNINEEDVQVFHWADHGWGGESEYETGVCVCVCV